MMRSFGRRPSKTGAIADKERFYTLIHGRSELLAAPCSSTDDLKDQRGVAQARLRSAAAQSAALPEY